MNVEPSFGPLGDVVKLVERLPFGRQIATVVSLLALLAIGLAAFLYIMSRAILPAIDLMMHIARGGPYTIHAGQILALIGAIGIVIGGIALARSSKRILDVLTVTIHEGIVGHDENLARINGLEKRVAALEKSHGDAISAAP